MQSKIPKSGISYPIISRKETSFTKNESQGIDGFDSNDDDKLQNGNDDNDNDTREDNDDKYGTMRDRTMNQQQMMVDDDKLHELMNDGDHDDNDFFDQYSDDYRSLNLEINSPESCFIDGGVLYDQPANSILRYLSANIINEIFQYVDQFDLAHLLIVCKDFYPLAIDRLYKRVTVVLNADIPSVYNGDHNQYIKDNGMKYMDSSLILHTSNLLSFLEVLQQNHELIQKVKYFIFDKCHSNIDLLNLKDLYHNHDDDNLNLSNLNLINDKTFNEIQLNGIQNQIIDFFGEYAQEISFLHITFVDFISGIEKYTKFLSNENIRNRIFKLFSTDLASLHQPRIPPSLTNLFLMLDELELMNIDDIDLSLPQYQFFNSLFTLTCSTNNQFGFEILKKLKLINPDLKLNLKGITIFHCHKENLLIDEELSFNNRSTSLLNNLNLNKYIDDMDKTLNFNVLQEKVNIVNLKNLYLKVDCNEHRNNHCNCFPNFFKDLNEFTVKNDGLPNLESFELELFPNLEWLRPHQLLENILTPLGNFIKNLNNLSRLTIDFSTPGFKMFDNSMGMTSLILNRLNERLMEAFFLCFLSSSNHNKTISNLKTLQLPDFLTSFIYYKPNFYESLLHTCKCWGCQLVLEKLKQSFYPLHEEDDDTDDDEETDNEQEEMDSKSTYYILIGFILGKLQADREVCVPIKQKTFNYSHYPIYKGQPHTLHSHFHKNTKTCKCSIQQDPHGKCKSNIDNLVTTYIIHQLRPIINYLSTIFYKLDNLMIHGIYYKASPGKGMIPIFDDDEYPPDFLHEKAYEIESALVPNVLFGKFRKY